MARKSKLSKERIESVCKYIKLGLPQKVAAAYSGINEATFYRWMERGESNPKSMYGEFCEAVKRAVAESEATLVANIRLAANKTASWQAAAWMLERRFPDRWARIEKREISGNLGHDVKYSDEEALKAYEDELKLAGKELGIEPEKLDRLFMDGGSNYGEVMSSKRVSRRADIVDYHRRKKENLRAVVEDDLFDMDDEV